MTKQKVMDKRKLDELIQLKKAYFRAAREDKAIWRPILDKQMEVAWQISRESGVSLAGILHMLDGIFSATGDLHEDTVRKVLEAIGWQISNE